MDSSVQNVNSTTTTSTSASSLMITSVECSSNNNSPLSTLDTGQMRSSSPFTPNSFPIHKNSLMSSSPPAATTAGSPLSNDTRLSPCKEPTLEHDQQSSFTTLSLHDGTESVSSSLSDVETFNGKIVYNPDGSAYIIEGPDSDGSEVEAEISQEGSIIDARGHSPNYGSISFPQIVSAFHISRSSAAELYSSICGSGITPASVSATDSSKAPEVPVMHSYRVFTLRNNNNKKKESSENKEKQPDGESGNEDDNNDDDEEMNDEQEEESKLQATNCTTVPVKPILMCFICKLSFGYTKSFVAHATGEHHIVLNDEEKRVLSSKNTSAIIQGVGKEKEPLLSFLQPKSSPTPFRTTLSQSQQQTIDAQRLLAVQMAVASALRSNNLPSSSTATATASANTPTLAPIINTSNYDDNNNNK